MRTFLFCLGQCIWGLPQTFLGLLEFFKHRKEPHYRYRGCIVTECEKPVNVSLGLFVFVAAEKGSVNNQLHRMLPHEYGHTIQSLILGPLYLPVVGIPSWLWCNMPVCRKLRSSRKISYHSFYTEKWADKLGKIKKG